MKKILINGYLGQMGRSVNDAIENSDAHEAIFYVDLNSKITSNCSNDFEQLHKYRTNDRRYIPNIMFGSFANLTIFKECKSWR